ncbi:MAG: lysylphosphatidylglycerol synthase transmembrane domain-containing protein, partial [Gaiella sp.]
DGRVGIVELDRASVAARPEQLLRDEAQLLATTAALVGVERAIAVAETALGDERLGVLLPYVQPAAFGPTLRRALKEAEIDVDDLRDAAAAAAGLEPPQVVKLRRVTWGTAIQIALLALAVTTLVGAASGLDYDELRSTLDDALWGWVALGFLVAQLPRFAQALSTIGSVPARLPYLPVYAMQLATGYMNLALPSNFARMAVNIRFFQRQGVPPATAVTSGAIDSFVSTVAQALLLVLLLLFSSATLDFDLGSPSGPPTRALVAIVVLGLLLVGALVAVRRVRTAIRERLGRWWPEVRHTLASLRAGNKLALLVGGSVAAEVLFAVALGIFALAMGTEIGLAQLLLINISVSLLASFVPVPGGIGVQEFGLTLGLTAAGMSEEAALTAVLLYRASTFYLPPLWGFFAMRWLQRTGSL